MATDKSEKCYFDEVSATEYVSIEDEVLDLIDLIPIVDKCVMNVTPKDIEKRCHEHFTGFSTFKINIYVE